MHHDFVINENVDSLLSFFNLYFCFQLTGIFLIIYYVSCLFELDDISSSVLDRNIDLDLDALTLTLMVQ